MPHLESLFLICDANCSEHLIVPGTINPRTGEIQVLFAREDAAVEGGTRRFIPIDWSVGNGRVLCPKHAEGSVIVRPEDS